MRLTMEKLLMKNNILSSVQRSVPMAETAAYHHQLITQINQQSTVSTPANPDTSKLMPFNGFYSLGNAVGAFFAVDTNMVVTPESPEPVFDLTLIVSLNGTSAIRYAFTGTFDGTTLNQTWEASGLSINLTFTRTVESHGPVASCVGSITLPGQSAVSVSGSTYNNPIPASLYTGDYYVEVSGSSTPIKAMSIGSDNQLYYDNGSNSGQLSLVTTYVYNMNMYYFTFMQQNDTVHLIMGTAANKGFACNNMTVGSSLVTRSLLTIPNAQSPPIELYDLSNCQLADFSGYYTTPNPNSPLAFVSIQAQYGTLLPNSQWDLTFVMISVSFDGVTSRGYYFNPFTMSFDGETLNMPQQGITLKLTRGYNPQNGSLVSISGTVNNKTISGFTPFNPVPLSVFGGLPMTNSQGDKLTVNNDNSVTYNGINMDSIIYVPLMYILAYPADNPTVVMSFGTDGTRGNACIVTVDANTQTPKTTSVWAIPS
jgi:hypothetical protein